MAWFGTLKGRAETNAIGKGNTRTFLGNDKDALNIGKCKEVLRVWVDNVEIPKLLSQLIPLSPTNHEQKITIQVPQWNTEVDDNGEMWLFRALQSNNGIWQSGTERRRVAIVVEGVWLDPVEANESNATVESAKRGRQAVAA